MTPPAFSSGLGPGIPNLIVPLSHQKNRISTRNPILLFNHPLLSHLNQVSNPKKPDSFTGKNTISIEQTPGFFRGPIA
jgi:hypothetical protein